jgi:Glyoxalase-like domain
VTGDSLARVAGASRVRLRQAVLAARDLEKVAGALQSTLALGEPFHDPGVGFFGLTNSVFALGDCFLEVVSPAQEGTAAGRYIDRHGGDCGYMVIFDLEDLDGARARVRELDMRVVWQVDLPDISATHLHPADTRGAIVSLDQSRPYGSWRWGGPEWTARVGAGAPGRLAGIVIAVQDPDAVATRWAQILGVPVEATDAPSLELDEAKVQFLPAADERSEGLVEIQVERPPESADAPETSEVGGVRVRLLDAP